MELATTCRECGVTLPVPGANCPACGAAPQADPSPPVRLLRNGEIRLLRKLGRGGMGRLYLASSAGQPYVVKELLLPESRSERATLEAMFEEEARLLARLGNDFAAIPRYYDSFMDSGSFYIVLEFVPGHNLEQLLAERTTPFSSPDAVNYIKQVVDLLAALHQLTPHPVIHGDLKPSNLILRPDGRIVVIDFGLARLSQPVPPYVPASGSAFGTPGYTPLEQWQGRPLPASDIFALGVTMHQLLTGRSPRASFSQLGQVNLAQLSALTTLPPLSSLVPTISPLLEALIVQMTRRTPRERPSARELKSRLASF